MAGNFFSSRKHIYLFQQVLDSAQGQGPGEEMYVCIILIYLFSEYKGQKDFQAVLTKLHLICKD